MSASNGALREIYVTGLRNAHAMEVQASELLTRQLGRLENYPEMEARMRLHLQETETQRKRLEEALAGLLESHSSLKDAAMGFMGNMAALAHGPAPDEVLKNTLANYAFEHYEIAAYKSLGAMADVSGHAEGLAAANSSLKEEVAMAQWLDEHIAPTTLQFLSRKDAGVKADR